MVSKFLPSIFILGLLFLSGCNSFESSHHKTFGPELISGKPDSILQLSFAGGFDIEYYGNVKRIHVRNPWQGLDDYEQVYLLADSNIKPDTQWQDYDIIRTPIRRIVCLSTTHIGFLEVLGELNSLVGISGSNLVCNTALRAKIESGELPDVGYESQLNTELLFHLKPDLVMVYSVGNEMNSVVNKLRSMGIHVVWNAEYLENHPLGKLEWIKFVASFFNKEAEAEQIFLRHSEAYQNLVKLTTGKLNKPNVLSGLPWKDVWYMAGRDSYLAQLIEDAGGVYLGDFIEGKQVKGFGIEAISVIARDADVWINTGSVRSLDEILVLDERLSFLPPFAESNVYNNIGQLSIGGGNAYWESGIVEPEVILSDLIRIFHPELIKHELKYYKKLEFKN